MNSADPKEPDDHAATLWYLVGYLRQEIILTGQISRRDWDNAVEAANRYKRSLPGESGHKPPQQSATDSE